MLQKKTPFLLYLNEISIQNQVDFLIFALSVFSFEAYIKRHPNFFPAFTNTKLFQSYEFFAFTPTLNIRPTVDENHFVYLNRKLVCEIAYQSDKASDVIF